MAQSRRPSLLLTALIAFATFVPLRAQAAEARRVAVVPFAALSGDLPNRAGDKAAGMLSTELKNTQGIALVATVPGATSAPGEEAILRARAHVEEASTLRNQRKFRLAEESLQKALTGYQSAIGALESVEEVSDAYALLAAVQYVTGQDEKGQASLDQALVLAGSRELALQKTSPLFSKVVDQRRKAVASAAKGALLIESSPAGAAVFLDGVAVGSSPLSVKDVPPGLHAWRVKLPSGAISGGLVEIASGKEAKVVGEAKGADPESQLQAALAQNSLDQKAIAAAKEHAKSLNAELLILGALSREGKGLALDGFLFTAESGELKRLPRKTFDNELLSAGMEFFNLAGELAKQGAAFGETTRVPVTVASARLAQPKLTEVKWGASRAAAAADDATQPAGGAEPAKQRAPLKTRKPLGKK